MRVLLADDQPALRSAVRLLLEQEPDVNIVAEVADTQSLLATSADVHPDLILLDWELPGLNNASAARSVLNTLYASNPKLQVVVFSGRPEAGRHALAAGASCFVSKADPPEHLLAALRQAKG
jgi:DNA-binding NarL/FixJ family response regulator